MRIRLNFNATDEVFNGTPTQNLVNGFVHRMLGKSNQYHDNFNEYSVSNLFGGVLTEKGMTYPNGGYFYLSTVDDTLMTTFLSNLSSLGNRTISTMTYKSFDIVEFIPNGLRGNAGERKHKYSYDIIHVNNIFFKTKEKEYIFFDDERFITLLTEHCKAKLSKLENGFSKKDVEGLIIKPFHFENGKRKFFKLKKELNAIPTSSVMLYVSGNPNMRKKLYEMGLGLSTGCGFGSVEIKFKA